MIAYTLAAHSLSVTARISAIAVLQVLLFFAFHSKTSGFQIRNTNLEILRSPLGDALRRTPDGGNKFEIRMTKIQNEKIATKTQRQKEETAVRCIFDAIVKT